MQYATPARSSGSAALTRCGMAVVVPRFVYARAACSCASLARARSRLWLSRCAALQLLAGRRLGGAQVVQRVDLDVHVADGPGEVERPRPPLLGASEVGGEHPQLADVAVGHRQLGARPERFERPDGLLGVGLGGRVVAEEPGEPGQPPGRDPHRGRVAGPLPQLERLLPGAQRLLQPVDEIALVGQPGQQVGAGANVLRGVEAQRQPVQLGGLPVRAEPAGPLGRPRGVATRRTRRRPRRRHGVPGGARRRRTRSTSGRPRRAARPAPRCSATARRRAGPARAGTRTRRRRRRAFRARRTRSRRAPGGRTRRPVVAAAPAGRARPRRRAPRGRGRTGGRPARAPRRGRSAAGPGCGRR